MAEPWPTQVSKWTVKLYVTNFQAKTTGSDLRRLFESVVGPENVVRVSMRGLSAVVHVNNEAAGERAIFELDGALYRGLRLVVRRFKGFKIFVGCVSKECTQLDLRVLFEKFGPVAECDIVKDYAFVHMENQEDARAAIENLHGTVVKGRRIYVVRSNKDRRRDPGEQNNEWDAGAGRNKISAKSDEDQPSASLEVDYGAQPTVRETAAYRNEPSAPFGNSYRNQSSFPQKTSDSKRAASAETAYSSEVAASHVPRYEDHYETDSRLAASSGRSFSSQSHSYEDQPSSSRAASYGSRAASDVPAGYRARSPADLAAAYDRRDATATPYATHFSDSLSTHDRASGESTYTVPLGSGYRAQPLGVSRSETTVRHSLYERVRLSPPRSSHEDLYGEVNAINRRYKQAADPFRPPYEYGRFSPPRGSHEDFDREGDRVNRRYAARPETAALRRPYERVPLSPPRNNHESKRYCSDYR